MKNSFLIGMALISVATIFSCKSNYICPSYESSYILDQKTRHQKFSLFNEDTLPREDFEVNKNKYGVIKSIKYKKKRDELLTVRMETVFPQVEELDTLLLAEQDLSPEDIERMINEGERPMNHFNVDQIYYMRHFGQYLPMPEEPSKRELEVVEEDEILEEPEIKKKKKWKFWKKEETDSLNIGFEEDLGEPQEEELSKKELRQQEQIEKEKEAEIERSKQPSIIDLDDFEKDRGISATPSNEKPSKKKKVKGDKPKEKKKIKLGFGKKKKKGESIELDL